MNEKSEVEVITKQLINLKAFSNFGTSDKDLSRLFSAVFENKHRYCSGGYFVAFDGGRWFEDVEGLRALHSAKLFSDALLVYAASIGDTEYLKSVSGLCSLRNRRNLVNDFKDINFFNSGDFDQNDFLLNVQNGVLDLSSDKANFMEHDPKLMLSKICNAEFDPDADCPLWKRSLNTIMEGNESKMIYFQKFMGMCLTGSTMEETFLICLGRSTRNGKSTLLETLLYLLGDYGTTIKAETLGKKNNPDSRAASPDLAKLPGTRLVVGSEPDKRMIFDVSLLKSLLGRDTIVARPLYKAEFGFLPKFKLLLNTNFLPLVGDDTLFQSDRVNVIEFNKRFEANERDKTLKDRLRQPHELSGILNWMIDGLFLYKQEGIVPPPDVQISTSDYRQQSDKIGAFFKEIMMPSKENCTAKDAYTAYATWCADNGYGIENKGNFFGELKNRGLFMASGTVGGKTCKNVIRGYVLEPEFLDYQGN